MFRITTQQRGPETVVILDGRLEDSELDEVRRVLEASAEPVELNLGGLEACTDAGITELRGWLNKGVRLGGATPFMRMLLTMKPDAAQPHV